MAWRRAVLKRDKKRCKICRSEKDLQAHHIRPYAQFVELRWELSNGLTLCYPCHKVFQGKELASVELLELLVVSPVVG